MMTRRDAALVGSEQAMGVTGARSVGESLRLRPAEDPDHLFLSQLSQGCPSKAGGGIGPLVHGRVHADRPRKGRSQAVQSAAPQHRRARMAGRTAP